MNGSDWDKPFGRDSQSTSGDGSVERVWSAYGGRLVESDWPSLGDRTVHLLFNFFAEPLIELLANSCS